MSKPVCESCLRFWPKKVEARVRRGTCYLDGSDTSADWSCGYHSDLVPIRPGETLPPKDYKNRKTAMKELLTLIRIGVR